MAQRRRRIAVVGLVVLSALAVGGVRLFIPLVNADDPPPLPIQFSVPAPLIPGKWWVPRYKGPSYGQTAAFSVGGGPSDDQYSWGGGGVYLNDQGQTAHGRTAHFHNITTGDMVAQCSHPAVPPTYGPGSCSSATICVFDVELTPPEPVGDPDEETVPTFIGEGCRKLLTLTVMPGVGSLPTPPDPAGSEYYDPHWVLTLDVENDPPGVAFYDPQTGEQLTDLTWGWHLIPGYFDWDTYEWVPGEWVPQPGGLVPPSTVLVGVVPGVGAPWGAPFFVHLSLSIQDAHPLSSAGASDRVMVVPMNIAGTVANDPDGDGPRDLWFFNVPGDSPDPELYSQVMTLTACPIQGLDDPIPVTEQNYVWSKTGDPVNMEAVGDHPDQVLARSARPSLDENDVEFTLKVLGQEAAKHKLTVYAPTKLRFAPKLFDGNWNRVDQDWSPEDGFVGFRTVYRVQVHDQFGLLPVPKWVTVNETFGPFNPQANNSWSSNLQDPAEMHWLSDGTGVVDDGYGRSQPRLLGALHPAPVFHDDPLAIEVVGDENQYYHVGSAQLGIGMACNHNGDGTGQIVWWFRGHARQVPEPPGDLYTPDN